MSTGALIDRFEELVILRRLAMVVNMMSVVCTEPIDHLDYEMIRRLIDDWERVRRKRGFFEQAP